MRPRSSEAAAGKNPISHVGKIYNAYTHEIARKIVENVPEVQEVYVWLLSKIGVPINNPAMAAAEVYTEADFNSVKERVEDILAKEIENIGEFVERLIEGMVPVY